MAEPTISSPALHTPSAGRRGTHRAAPGLRGTAVLVTLLLAVFASAPATAQQASALPPNDNTLTANPFLLLFEWFNAEWEHRIAPNRTVGLQASHFSVSDASYTSASALFRVYPQERAPSGFFVGGKLGGHYIDEDDILVGNDEEFAIGFGIEVGYTWLFGSQEDFVLSIGAGVTRLFSDVGDGFLPGIRLVNVGWSF